jgi:hypothetical protein
VFYGLRHTTVTKEVVNCVHFQCALSEQAKKQQKTAVLEGKLAALEAKSSKFNRG